MKPAAIFVVAETAAAWELNEAMVASARPALPARTVRNWRSKVRLAPSWRQEVFWQNEIVAWPSPEAVLVTLNFSESKRIWPAVGRSAAVTFLPDDQLEPQIACPLAWAVVGWRP